MKIKHINIIALFLLVLTLGSCREDDIVVEPDNETVPLDGIEDWTEATHSKNAEPNYDMVFNQNKVLRLDITISSTNWSSMQTNLESLVGGSGRGPGAAESTSDEDPIWVESSLVFNNREWYKVGIRYKGNSSLTSAYNSGNKKLSFKLDFDEFEDTYPELENQRFYGFKQLNLNNNFDDASLMREKTAADLFRNFGLVAPQTSFCAIYLDYGDGPQYFGLYTIVEEVDDTVIEEQFDDDSGNLYKPDGDAASFAKGSFDEEEMYKKTNEEEADFSDVEQLYNIINNDSRTSNNETWRKELEQVFDVDGFLKWLAANTTIQNWDTYGNMTHNYYMYNNPSNNLLTWMPWDNNEAFQDGKMGGSLSFQMTEIDSSWPLIRYIIDVDEYKTTYEAYLTQFTADVFTVEKLTSDYSRYHELLKEYAYAEESGYTYIGSNGGFDSAVEELKTHVQQRNTAVENYLNK